MTSKSYISVKEYEDRALAVLPKGISGFFKGGAGDELTLRENQEAFSRLRIRPRCLRDVSSRTLETSIFGSNVEFPVGLAPSSMQKAAHPDGEVASVQAAGEMGTIYTLSTVSTTSIEDVANAAPNTIKWFQLYIYKDREITKSLIRRAEASGFKALVLTVDTPVLGIRRSDMQNQFTLPPNLTLANFVGESASTNVTSDRSSNIFAYVKNFMDSSLTWKDVNWLASITKLPIVAKGILTAEDAIMAADSGCKGIIVSNHGGRQLDSSPATIEALPEVVRAVGHRIPVFMDGGVTQGTDVLKALAIGAKMVFIGRPVLWGLACGGKDGVKDVLQIIKHELDTAMAISGCRCVEDITKDLVVHQSFYSRL